MSRDRRFFAGLVGVATIVTWLVWTGISDTMVYYLTPAELMERADSAPEMMEQGVKVSGDVLPGSHAPSSDELLHTFVVLDPDDPEIQLTVHFRHPLPDTFTDEAEVVMEGRYAGNGVFEATEVLTKCGSRYEALPEEMYDGAGDYGDGYPGGGDGGYGGYGEDAGEYDDPESGAGGGPG